MKPGRKPKKSLQVSGVVYSTSSVVISPRVQRSLLDIEERAVLIAELEAVGEEGAGDAAAATSRSCRRSCYLACCDIGSISILVTLVLVLVGVVLLVVVRALDWPVGVDRFSRYVISAGVFGLATGGTNAVAVLMLLYNVPLICGSGLGKLAVEASGYLSGSTVLDLNTAACRPKGWVGTR